MVAAPELAAMITAALWASLCIAGYLLIRAIGHLLPNVSILGVGLNFASWFEHAAGGLENWLVHQSKDAWHFVGDLWHLTAHVFSTAFGDVVDAISHTGDNIAYLATHAIPRAASGAVTDAANYTDKQVGVIEGRISDAYDHALAGFGAAERAAWEAAAHGTENVANNLLGVVSHGVDTAISWADHRVLELKATVEGDLHDAIAAVRGDIGDLHRLLAGQISALADTVAADYRAALSAAQADANTVLNTATDLVNAARNEAESVAAADAAKVQSLLQAAIDATTSTVSALTTTVGQDFTAAETQARNEVAAAVSTVTGQLNNAVSTLNNAIGAGAAAAAAGIQGAIDQAQQDANTAIGAVTGTIDSVLGGIAADVRAGDQIYHGDLAGTAETVALVITGAVAGVAARVAKLEKCSVGVCEDSPNNFGNLLNDALGIASAAGAFAYLEQAVTDPSGTATKTTGLLRPVADDSVKLLDTLLGLPAL